MKTENPDQIFAHFLSESRILIVDTSSVSRVSMGRMLSEMGSNNSQVFYASSLVEAEEKIDLYNPSIIICEYNLGNDFGLDILQKQREASNNRTRKSLFVLVTGNTSQSAIARAAEEDVDCFILKPYTINRFKNTLNVAVLEKLYPTEYIRTIEEGKAFLYSGKTDASVDAFLKALKLHPKPALAFYYLGQAQIVKKIVDQAKDSYHQGISVNSLHYKCLIGLYELLFSQKKYEEAYIVVRKIAKYFPANPRRLTSVIRLAIITNNYQDIENYYQTFIRLDTRNEELIRYVCSALIVCGKYFIKRGETEKALELFKSAGVSAADRTRYLRYIIEALVEFSMQKEALEFLNRYPAELHKSKEFLTMKFLIFSLIESPSKIISLARELIAQNIKDPAIYKILIRHSYDAGLLSAAESSLFQAKSLWPELSTDFEQLVSRVEPLLRPPKLVEDVL